MARLYHPLVLNQGFLLTRLMVRAILRAYLTPRGGGVLNMEELLTLEEIRAQLDRLPGWEQDGNEIMWRYRAPSFAAAISLVNAVADLAEKANHHPDILVQCCNVELFLSTHSAGGLTSRDFALAAQINRLVS